MGIDLDRTADLVSVGSEALEDVIRRAYERGVADGRRIASEQFKERIAGFLNEEPEAPSNPIVPSSQSGNAASQTATRAPRGSVEPVVIAALPETGKGKRPAEIAAETGLPENTVRGRLNKLRTAGRAQKTGEYWIRLSAPASAGNGNPGSGEPGNV